ncbi:uncharacterized protein OCT59_009061 [Rhizophagus irregularis]|uniref:uncharacterized protein n=1 Tax=Rhizophagus irregularis TaxID=588596 RepID=UPI0033322C2E|nr:hypothetical protein OCT59_009061 [Rhizophagus irregularis]
MVAPSVSYVTFLFRVSFDAWDFIFDGLDTWERKLGMTWVIVRHWTRKFLIVAISSDYFKHVRIWQTRSSEKTEIQVLNTGRLSSL